MLKFFLFTVLLISSLASAKDNLIFYCGITMVKPMKKIATLIEKKYNCTINIMQGGSQDLYDSLKFSKIGDLYLPGSEAYIKKYKKDGFFQDSTCIGYNQAAIFVKKGNPKNIKSLDSLMDENIATALCDPKHGSIGKETKKLLKNYKGDSFYQKAYENAAMISTDSRDLNALLLDNSVDMSINWKATAYWGKNAEKITVIPIDEKFAKKKRLIINMLSFSKHKDIAKAFIRYCVSNNGKKLIKKYGF